MSGQGPAQGQGQLPANLTKEQVAQILQVRPPVHPSSHACLLNALLLPSLAGSAGQEVGKMLGAKRPSVSG